MSTTRLYTGLLLVVLGFAVSTPLRAVPQPRADAAESSELAKLTDEDKARLLEEDVTQGALRVIQEDGKVVECPLRHTDVQAEVSGFIARVKVTQTFYNPTDERIEAVYVFPLPHQAAVDAMTMRIGERRIVGVIKRRAEARQIYEQALAAGQTAALLEQERPNIFTQSVGNIDPAQEVNIEIQYVDVLEYDLGTYEFHFPMVVGPRFIPGAPIDVPPETPADLQGAVSPPVADTTRVPDASRITPPVLKPGYRNGHNISLAVQLDAGVPIQNLKVANHEADVARKGKQAASVTLSPADAIPNKDFVLRYHVVGKRPEMGLLAHTGDRPDARRLGQGYFMLMVQPQEDQRLTKSPPREIVFLLDVSGSMSGQPTEKVKQTMREMLGLCREVDTLQVITFASQTNQLFERPVPVTDENVSKAVNFTRGLSGGGGTYMLQGVKRAIDQPLDPERLRIVIMLTDGYIGNEAEIIEHVGTHCGDQVRFWAIGIGSSPNMFLIDGVARQGGGMGKRLGLEDNAAGLAEEVITRIQRAQLAQVQIDWGGLDVCETYPVRLPELWAGRPLIVFGRYRGSGRAVIRLEGRIEGEPAAWPLDVDLPAEQPQHAALASVWARKKIEDLMQQTYYAGSPAVEEAVTAIALDYRLMSQYTSFVAVDADEAEEVAERMVADPPRRMLVPVPLPEGTRWEGFFGPLGDEEKEEESVSSLSLGLAPHPTGPDPAARPTRVRMLKRLLAPASAASGAAPADRFGTQPPGRRTWGTPAAGQPLRLDGLARGQAAAPFARRRLRTAQPAASFFMRNGRAANQPLAAGVALRESLAAAEDESAESLADLAHALPRNVEVLRTTASESLKRGRQLVQDGSPDAASSALLEAWALASAAANAGDYPAAAVADEALAAIQSLHADRVETWRKRLAPLSKKLPCVLRDVSVREALDEIAAATGLSCRVLPGSLADAEAILAGSAARVTYLDLRGIDAAQALDWLLQPLRLSWQPAADEDLVILVGSQRRFPGRHAWVYDVSRIGIPSFEELQQGDDGQQAAAWAEQEAAAFVQAIRKALEATETEVAWYAPGQLLVIGEPSRHGKAAELLDALADAEARPRGISTDLHRKTAARAAKRREAHQAWLARRRLLEIASVHETFGWALLAAAAGGRLDLEALTELQVAWDSDAMQRLLDGPGAGIALRSAWTVTRASRLLPDQAELAALADSAGRQIADAAAKAVSSLEAAPQDPAAILAAVYAGLATEDPQLSARVLAAMEPATDSPAAVAGRFLLQDGGSADDERLADLLAGGQIAGEDATVLVALACRRAGGSTWEAFREASHQLLGRQPLPGSVVVLVNRLSGSLPALAQR